MTAIIAHRTCPVQAPENSLEGIGVAAALKSDAVEIDLRMSLDQRPFLLHDNTLRRTTTGPAWPLELTPSRMIRRLKLRNSEELIPTLEAAIASLGPEMMLAVDVKTPWAVIALVREVRRRGLESRTLIWCTSALAARYAVKRLPDAEVAYLKDVTGTADRLNFIARAVQLGCRAVSAHWLAIDPWFVGLAHSAGLKVYSFHSGYDLTPEKLSSGLDGLITDFPLEAREALANLTQ